VERELCIVALLAVLDVPKQLYSHLRGALNVGAHAWQVLRALDIGLGYTEDDVATRGWKTWKALQSRAAVGG
jgi:alkylhydroperoxidase/carboxymuconolactone decarboxylase family protein YurZ